MEETLRERLTELVKAIDELEDTDGLHDLPALVGNLNKANAELNEMRQRFQAYVSETKAIKERVKALVNRYLDE